MTTRNFWKNDRARKQGFTLIEVLVVIAIIGLLASVVLNALGSARTKSRDARRLGDTEALGKALAIYFQNNSAYPPPDSQGAPYACGGWDSGGDGVFISALRSAGILAKDALDPTLNNACGNYAYYVYGAGSYGCEANRGAFYVLGVRDMETSSSPHPASPGFNCPSRDWQTEFDWVSGGFEK